jgi:hypothetical protein
MKEIVRFSNSALALSRDPGRFLPALARWLLGLFLENAAEPEVEPAVARESRTA